MYQHHFQSAYTAPIPLQSSPYARDNALPPKPMQYGAPMGQQMPAASPYPEFEVERTPRYKPRTPPHSPRGQSFPRGAPAAEDTEQAYWATVARFLEVKARPMSVSGTVPLDPASLVLFFRTRTGVTHSLDFPIDVDFDTPPALDVLISTCRPYSSARNDYPTSPRSPTRQQPESLVYPPNLALTSTLELSNHPVLDAVRNSLLPFLPAHRQIIAKRDKLECMPGGAARPPQPRFTDGRVATICVLLPVLFRGGALIVRDDQGREERFHGNGGKAGSIEWNAYSADSEYEIEAVQGGCRISLTYGVYLKDEPARVAEPLMNPSDDFLDALSDVLNSSQGRKIAFNITHDYGVNPAESLAEEVIPQLRGGDALLFHAFKMFKIQPELHWSAGGYIWPVAHVVDVELDENAPLAVPEDDLIRSRIVQSGAIRLVDADINVLKPTWDTNAIIGKERVPFVADGGLQKLVVNILLVAYIH